MVTLIVPNTYLVAINAESSGQAVTNVIGVEGAFLDSTVVANTVHAAWIAAGGPITQRHTSYTLKNVTATFLGVADGEIDTNDTPASGTITGTISTNAACALITYGGGSRARTSKGRMYHGPLTETQVNPDGRTIQPSSIISLKSAYEQFSAQLTAASMGWVVISRKLSTTNAVGAITVQAVIATQRRRIRS